MPSATPIPTIQIGFTNNLARTDSAEKAIEDFARTDSRPIARALVKCTPASEYVHPYIAAYYQEWNLIVFSGKRSWHTGGTDPNAKEHLTVEMLDANGNHITTLHIGRNGKRV